ncbi:uncharacterized protein METZ01_LOCUS123199 [marine metagenome]|uniref:Reactive intermediate/imine deaminase n=1 Tax=marine metagenome TaxID=408172 RepID=A0A381Y074_9ZZZZ|tara:strand:+ start:462 stop:854 length:393 start_codon:yes stop_codon:yes gene_type:complete
MKKKIETDKAPGALGTYSQAIESNNMIYLSGQIPIDPKTSKIVKGDENQIRQVFRNIKAVSEACESSLDQIVKLTVYLIDLNIFPVLNEIMKEFFEEPFPARAVVQVARLPLDSQIEIEGIIVKEDTYNY